MHSVRQALPCAGATARLRYPSSHSLSGPPSPAAATVWLHAHEWEQRAPCRAAHKQTQKAAEAFRHGETPAAIQYICVEFIMNATSGHTMLSAFML
jgi:hypothetical protein